MIFGSSRVFAIIADPVDSVRTPEVMNSLFQELAIDAVIIPMQVDPAGLHNVVSALRLMKNLGGIVVSHPHKTAMVPLCDEISLEAISIGSINAIRREQDGRLVADMFDGTGFILGARNQGIDIAGRHVMLAGESGAAAAVAVAIAQNGAASLTVTGRDTLGVNRIKQTVESLLPDFSVRVGGSDPTGHDLIINAQSPARWSKDTQPIDTDRLTSDMIAADTYSKPEITPFLKAATAKGSRLHYGRFMLDSQIRLIAEFIGAIPDARIGAKHPH